MKMRVCGLRLRRVVESHLNRGCECINCTDWKNGRTCRTDCAIYKQNFSNVKNTHKNMAAFQRCVQCMRQK